MSSGHFSLLGNGIICPFVLNDDGHDCELIHQDSIPASEQSRY